MSFNKLFSVSVCSLFLGAAHEADAYRKANPRQYIADKSTFTFPSRATPNGWDHGSARELGCSGRKVWNETDHGREMIILVDTDVVWYNPENRAQMMLDGCWNRLAFCDEEVIAQDQFVPEQQAVAGGGCDFGGTLNGLANLAVPFIPSFQQAFAPVGNTTIIKNIDNSDNSIRIDSHDKTITKIDDHSRTIGRTFHRNPPPPVPTPAPTPICRPTPHQFVDRANPGLDHTGQEVFDENGPTGQFVDANGNPMGSSRKAMTDNTAAPANPASGKAKAPRNQMRVNTASASTPAGPQTLSDRVARQRNDAKAPAVTATAVPNSVGSKGSNSSSRASFMPGVQRANQPLAAPRQQQVRPPRVTLTRATTFRPQRQQSFTRPAAPAPRRSAPSAPRGGGGRRH